MVNFVSGGSGSGSGAEVGKLTEGIGFDLVPITDESVVTVTLTATDDAGNGSVEDDTNNTDFTSQTGTTFATLATNEVVNIVHKVVVYSYTGPKPVNIGLGGDYVTLASDFVALGTADHSLLDSLSDPDQHPTSAITGLDTDQATQDQNLVDHEVAADPHTQYVLNTEAIGLFVTAAYGGVSTSGDVAMANITAAFQTLLGLDTGTITTPKGITQDTVSSGLVFNLEGVFSVSGQATLTFLELNAGRELDLRFWNLTDGVQVGTIELTYFIGRNQGGVAMPFTLVLDIPGSLVGKVIVLQVGGADDFTIVTNIGTVFQANHVSELLALP